MYLNEGRGMKRSRRTMCNSSWRKKSRLVYKRGVAGGVPVGVAGAVAVVGAVGEELEWEDWY